MLTIRNTNVETIDRNTVNIGGHEIRCTWSADGWTVDRGQLRAIRDAGDANWSDEEIDDIAYYAETRMQETFGVTAKHEVRVPDGTGWYVYRGTECQGGPWETEDQALDAETLLYEATADQFDRFEAAASAAGHASGRSAANDGNLWGKTVADAIAAAGNQEECGDAPRLTDYLTGEDLRDATDEEIAASRDAGPEGVILLADDGTILRADDAGADDARRVYVAE